MNIYCKIFFSALLVFVLNACTSITYTDVHKSPKVERIASDEYKQIMITNYGYYFFNCIPLGSGGESDSSMRPFCDNVNQADTMAIFNRQCQENGVTEFSDLQVRENSTCFFGWMPILGTTFGLYWYREVQVSAVINVGNKTCHGKKKTNETN